MPQYHGPAPFAFNVVLSSEELMDALVQDNVLRVDLSRATFDSLSHEQKMRVFKREGYYGWKHGQVLEEDANGRLQPSVQKLASRYISPEGRDVVHGKDHRDK